MNPNNLSKEEIEILKRINDIQRDRLRAISPLERKILFATALGSVGVTAGGAAVDQFVGDANGLNSGELAANIPLAALPIGTGALGAYLGNRTMPPEARDQYVNDAVTGAKMNLKSDARANGYDYAQQKFADAKNSAIEAGYRMRNIRTLAGMAGGALIGGGASLAAMQDAPQSLMNSIPPEKAAEIQSLLRANGAA